MPSLGADMETGKLVQWLVKAGDRVKSGDVVAVVETHKGAIDVEIFLDGIIDNLAALDKEVPVGTVLATVRQAGEAATVPAPAAAPAALATPAPAVSEPEVAPRVAANVGRMRISPAARQRAQQLGVDVAALGAGSGEGGAICLRDVEAGGVRGTRLLIDCGLPVRQALARIEARGVDPMGLDAILVTHEHGDHVGGVMALARKTGATVCLTRGTHAAVHMRTADACKGVALRLIDSHLPFELGCVEIQPFPVPHDAREPVQYVVEYGPLRLGVLTDLGMLTPHVERSLQACDGLVLEFNHDPDLLAGSSYPDSLKQRIAGRYGHLCNREAAGFLGRLNLERLQHIVAAHLSRSNNSSDHVLAAVREVLIDVPHSFYVATQEDGFDWLTLTAAA